MTGYFAGSKRDHVNVSGETQATGEIRNPTPLGRKNPRKLEVRNKKAPQVTLDETRDTGGTGSQQYGFDVYNLLSGALMGSKKTEPAEGAKGKSDDEQSEQQQGSVRNNDEAEKKTENAGKAEQPKRGWFGTTSAPKPADTAKADAASATLQGGTKEEEEVNEKPKRGWFGRKSTPNKAK